MSGSIFWIGDSTVQENRIDTWPQCGMGQVLYLYLRPGIQVYNYAKNGRSTRSFAAEGRFLPVESALRSGDILLIQFGHNDEKTSDPTRYAAPEEYAANLLRFARAAQKKGALPVLVTPLARRWFTENALQSSHGDYPHAARALAESENLPLIDLTAASSRVLEMAGEEESRTLYMNLPAGKFPNYPDGKQDNTHLQYEGAVRFSALIAFGLQEFGKPYSDVLAENIEITSLGSVRRGYFHSGVILCQRSGR